jgi:integrase
MWGLIMVSAFSTLHDVSECFISTATNRIATEDNHIMQVTLKTQRDGRIRGTWYGRYEIGGKRRCLNLNVKVAGTPPASLSLREEGDSAYERSRATAIAKLESIVAEARSQRSSERLVEKLYEIKTGEKINCVKLADLAAEWAKIGRKRTPDARYAAQCQSKINQFVAHVHGQNSKAADIADVTRTMARAFLAAEEKRGITGKTWNDTLVLLRATFQHLLPPGSLNPFAGIPTRETDTVFRKPFTPEELKAILDAAKGDDFIRPVLVAGVCTAMRRGDCCLLKWSDVDLENRFISVKTAKTGQTVTIPIIPLLYDELSARQGKSKGFVFPDQAEMYLTNADGITWRVKKILAVALGGKETKSNVPPALPAEEVKERGNSYIASLPDGQKKDRMKTVFDHYAGGKKTCEVVALAGVSKGSVSGYLNEIEANIGCQLVRGRQRGLSLTARLKNDNGLLSAERKGGTRSASVRDFHSFRVTWVTLALAAGVPLELVRKVTGHRNANTVLEHYFQPGREDFRRALQSAMPMLLTNGQQSPKDEMRGIVEKITAKTLKQDKARLLKLMAQG